MAICMAGIEKLSGIKSAIKKSSINGVVIRQANEVNVVMLIDSGTLPRAKSVKIFDTVPPGIEAIRAKPITTPADNWVNVINPKAISGTTSSCIIRPRLTAFGCCTTSRKSEVLRPAPMPSIASDNCTAATQYSWSR